jgi:hypothetical protein
VTIYKTRRAATLFNELFMAAVQHALQKSPPNRRIKLPAPFSWAEIGEPKQKLKAAA